jgi:hypothetical protein
VHVQDDTDFKYPPQIEERVERRRTVLREVPLRAPQVEQLLHPEPIRLLQPRRTAERGSRSRARGVVNSRAGARRGCGRGADAAGGGSENNIPVERKGHCLSYYVPDGLDRSTVLCLRGPVQLSSRMGDGKGG